MRVEEVSIGDFVLIGGEVAVLAMIEATVRLMPGVLGNPAPPRGFVLRRAPGRPRATPGPRCGATYLYRRCCSPVITPKLPRGATKSRWTAPANADPISWSDTPKARPDRTARPTCG